MKTDIVILGGAYLAREIYSMVLDCIDDGAPWTFKGFLDDRLHILDDFPHEGEMLGPVETYSPGPNDRLIVALGNPGTRERYVGLAKANGCRFGTLIHPSVLVGRNVHIGDGCVVTQRVTLTADMRIGNFVNIGCATTLSHGNEIGDFSQFAGNCAITGEVHIGRSVECGCSVSVVPHIRIGNYAQLCTGSVILRDVRDYERVLGNPARVIGMTNESL